MRPEPTCEGSAILAGVKCGPTLENISIESWFYYFGSPADMESEMAAIRALPDVLTSPWWYGTDEANPQGQIVQWTDANGAAWLVWTHDAVGMMGQSLDAFGSTPTLFTWWSELGSDTRPFTR